MLIFPLLGEGEEKGGEGKIKFGFEFSNVSFCRVERYFPLLPPGNIFRQGLPDKMLRDHDKHRRFFKQTLPWYFRDQVTQTFSRDRDKILDQKIRQPRTGWPKFYFMVIQTKTSIFRISTFPKSICDTITAKKSVVLSPKSFFWTWKQLYAIHWMSAPGNPRVLCV